jgi:DNA mismatch repair protein MutS
MFLNPSACDGKTVCRLLFLSLHCSLCSLLLASESTSQPAVAGTVAPIQENDSTPINFCAAIAKENLKSLSDVNKNQVDDFDFENFDAAVYFKAEFEKLLHPDPGARRRAMFTLLSNFEEKNPVSQANVLDYKTWVDLDLLCGPKSDVRLYVAAQLDRTVTEAGRVVFYRKLADPQSDMQQLENQQAVVKYLLNNEPLFNELDATLKALVESENLMLSYWYAKHFSRWELEYDKFRLPLASKVTSIKDLENWINKSPVMWQARNAEGHIFSGISKILFFYWFLAVPLYAVMGVDVGAVLPRSIYESKWFPKARDMSSFVGFSIYSALGITSWLISKVCEGDPNRASFQRLTKGGLALYGTMDEMYWKMMSFSQQKAQDEFYYAKVVHVARYINSLKAMAQLVANNEVLAAKMPSIRSFNEHVAALGKSSEDMHYLLELLEKETFDGNYSPWFMYWGRVKIAFALIAELKSQFIGMMIALGELDAQLSIAKLYKEFTAKRVTFCFPTYIDPLLVASPAVTVTDFWNPLIDPDRVVPSSLDIGEPYATPQNVVITGPNASGKSTITKAFMLTVILAQSLGIAPAKALALTPFSKIITYLNITDDIAAGNSHFKAGVLRAREVEELFKGLKPHAFGLAAIDEVFNGTTFEEGQAAAYSLIKLLGQNPLGMCITNTHFKIIPTLEQSMGRFMNYKVSVIERPGERIQYPFKLERGVANQNVAFKILKEEGFGDEFLDQAQRVLDGAVAVIPCR